MVRKKGTRVSSKSWLSFTSGGEGWISGGGGLIFIYSCSALLISFEIHCFQGI